MDRHRLIVGSPDDTRWPYIQHPTPSPRTPMTKALAQRGLITSDRVEDTTERHRS